MADDLLFTNEYLSNHYQVRDRLPVSSYESISFPKHILQNYRHMRTFSLNCSPQSFRYTFLYGVCYGILESIYFNEILESEIEEDLMNLLKYYQFPRCYYNGLLCNKEEFAKQKNNSNIVQCFHHLMEKLTKQWKSNPNKSIEKVAKDMSPYIDFFIIKGDQLTIKTTKKRNSAILVDSKNECVYLLYNSHLVEHDSEEQKNSNSDSSRLANLLEQTNQVFGNVASLVGVPSISKSQQKKAEVQFRGFLDLIYQCDMAKGQEFEITLATLLSKLNTNSWKVIKEAQGYFASPEEEEKENGDSILTQIKNRNSYTNFDYSNPEPCLRCKKCGIETAEIFTKFPSCKPECSLEHCFYCYKLMQGNPTRCSVCTYALSEDNVSKILNELGKIPNIICPFKNCDILGKKLEYIRCLNCSDRPTFICKNCMQIKIGNIRNIKKASLQDIQCPICKCPVPIDLLKICNLEYVTQIQQYNN